MLLIVDDGTNAVVVMCTDERTCRQLREHIQSNGRDNVMKRKLQEYFAWKANFQKSRTELFEKKPDAAKEDGIIFVGRTNMRYCRGSTLKIEEKGHAAK
jgi:hypothetical protein